MVTRRELLIGGAATIAASSLRSHSSAATMKIGYAAITWGGNVTQAIDDISAVGFHGIQPRIEAFQQFGDRAAALKELLQQRKLAFAVLSSGNLSIDPAREREMLDAHVQHARFLRAAGGENLQVIDEKPKDRAVGSADYRRVGTLLTELGKRTADVGVQLVYHHHMNSIGEKPHEVDAVLDAADRRHVGLLFDIAHFQQGGGDPVAAIRKYREWIRVVHLKDVRPNPDASSSTPYQFVELGRGTVDVAGALAALNAIAFDGWAIVELDRVPDAGSTPKSCAETNKRFLVGHGVAL